MGAYETLYSRSVDAARRYARSLTRCPADADDAVAEAFTRILDLLERGRGPREAFVGYLLRTVRNLVNDGHRRERRVTPSEDVAGGQRLVASSRPDATVLTAMEAATVRRAFDRLHDSWREVLLQVDIAERAPRVVAEASGENPHTVSGRVHRAREGLRDAYLSEVVTHGHDACEDVSRRLGARVRDTVGPRERQRIDRHLASCLPCRRRHAAVLEEAHAWSMATAPPLAG